MACDCRVALSGAAGATAPGRPPAFGGTAGGPPGGPPAAVAAHVTVALHGDAIAPDAEAAVVFVPGDDASYVVARNLPATPAGHGYQLWYADEAGVHPLQTVAYDGSGTFLAPIGVDLADSSAVMITLEAEGGAQGEPGPQVVFGEL